MQDSKNKTILLLHASADMYGSDYVLFCLLRELKDKRYNPIVILPYKGKLCSELDKISVNYRIYNIPVLRRSVFTPIGIIKFVFQSINFLFKLSKIVRKEKVSIIHTNTSAIWMGGVTAFLFKKKHVWQVMELVEKPVIVSKTMRKIVGLFSTKVFTISDAVRKFFVEVNPNKADKFSTLYHGVDMNVYDYKSHKGDLIREKIGVSKEAILIGMAGRINSWKGHDVFVKAIPQILNKYKGKNIHFLMLGDTFQGQEHFEVELRKLIDSLNISNHLTFLGFQEDFVDWLGAMDIFVLPSKWPEPNATVTIAAMTMKKPIVATKIGGTVESVIHEKTGLLINPDDEADLAEKIITIIETPSLIEAYGKNGYDRAMKYFSIKNYCNTIINEYERI